MNQVHQSESNTHQSESRLPARTAHQNNLSTDIDVEDTLAEAVRRALSDTGYPAFRDIQIEIERGIVLLWGQVPSYYQKQLAQVKVQQIDGVRGIANGIEVVCCR